MNKNNRIYLNGSDWLYKEFVGQDWVWRNSVKPDTNDTRFWKEGRVPGSVHHELLQSGEIPDPYFEKNSLLLEWIPDRTWVYKKVFFVENQLKDKRIFLHFKGVDYEASFFLNGDYLGRHTGMYTPVDFDVTDSLRYGEENLIAVVIERAPDEEPQVSKTEFVHTHKSRMTYWWDFCPRMIHLGIWDDVYLEVTDSVRIRDLFVRPQLVDNYSKAYLDISTQLEIKEEVIVEVETIIKHNNNRINSKKTKHALASGTSCLNTCLEINDPELWWPNGYGEQPLYQAEIKVRLLNSKRLSDSAIVDFAIRKVELIENETEDETAHPYTFVVNGSKVYIKGWNWVPIDVMYGVERPNKLERLLTLAKEANVNMLRVWGGGLIEKDLFYEYCNRYGLMVWQEFIQSSSGIGNKPSEDPEFIKMMVEEAEEIIPKKRNHPSLVLWCGGNELQDGDENPIDDKEPVIAALKQVVNRLDPDRHWLPTSPTGRFFGNTLKNIGKDPDGLHDVHGPWEHQGLVEHYTLSNSTTSLLHSEFGVEGLTNLRTLNRTISKKNQWPATKENPIYFHRGAWWINEPLIQKSFAGIDDIETLVKASQFLQAEGLRYAIEADRRRKYQNSGTLPWQFNEPYPNGFCTAAIDYYARPKPVYYAVKRAYQTINVTARFARQVWSEQEEFAAEIWSNNSGLEEDKNIKLRARITGASGEVFKELEDVVSLKANSSNLLNKIKVATDVIRNEIFFLDLTLWNEREEIANNRYIFTKTDNLATMLSHNSTLLEFTKEENGDNWLLNIKNKGQDAALLVRLEDLLDLETDAYPYFTDNYFTLLPDEEKMVSVCWNTVPKEKRELLIYGWNIDKNTLA